METKTSELFSDFQAVLLSEQEDAIIIPSPEFTKKQKFREQDNKILETELLTFKYHNDWDRGKVHPCHISIVLFFLRYLLSILKFKELVLLQIYSRYMQFSLLNSDLEYLKFFSLSKFQLCWRYMDF
jgi:hypothetical protein